MLNIFLKQCLVFTVPYMYMASMNLTTRIFFSGSRGQSCLERAAGLLKMHITTVKVILKTYLNKM